MYWGYLRDGGRYMYAEKGVLVVGLDFCQVAATKFSALA